MVAFDIMILNLSFLCFNESGEKICRQGWIGCDRLAKVPWFIRTSGVDLFKNTSFEKYAQFNTLGLVSIK